MAQPQPFAVRISFGYTDPEAVKWSGSVSADQATITSLEGWLFMNADSISLNTFEISAGEPVNKGFTITGTASNGGRITVLTDRGSFSIPVFNLTLGNPVLLLDGAARAERLPDAVNLSDGSAEDDYPSIAMGKDSRVWAVWQSYFQDQDEVRLAKYEDNWRTYTTLPGVSGDVWRPQVAVDHGEKPTVVWSQQVQGNFDLYARTLDPETQTWSKMLRLSSHPNPDIDHHFISSRDGTQWLVWQGFHGDNSDIFLRHNNGAGWSQEVRVTEDPANDWETAHRREQQWESLHCLGHVPKRELRHLSAQLRKWRSGPRGAGGRHAPLRSSPYGRRGRSGSGVGSLGRSRAQLGKGLRPDYRPGLAGERPGRAFRSVAGASGFMNTATSTWWSLTDPPVASRSLSFLPVLPGKGIPTSTRN